MTTAVNYADVLDKIATPGYMNQVPAAHMHRFGDWKWPQMLFILNYQGWSGCWTGPRLWIGSTAGSDYHGDYCVAVFPLEMRRHDQWRVQRSICWILHLGCYLVALMQFFWIGVLGHIELLFPDSTSSILINWSLQ